MQHPATNPNEEFADDKRSATAAIRGPLSKRAHLTQHGFRPVYSCLLRQIASTTDSLLERLGGHPRARMLDRRRMTLLDRSHACVEDAEGGRFVYICGRIHEIVLRSVLFSYVANPALADLLCCRSYVPLKGRLEI